MQRYLVTVSFLIDSNLSAEQVSEQVADHLEYGTVRDSFIDADMDVSYFSVEHVQEHPNLDEGWGT